MDPIGLDRRYNRYWHFCTHNANVSTSGRPDPGAGRIFVENAEDGSWWLVSGCEQLDGLLKALDSRGVREMELLSELSRIQGQLRQAMPVAPLQIKSIEECGEAAQSAPLVRSRLHADRHLPPGWHLSDAEHHIHRRSSTSGSRCGRLLQLKQQMLRLQAALPTSAVLPEYFDRYDL
jgi:hypothetical protein